MCGNFGFSNCRPRGSGDPVARRTVLAWRHKNSFGFRVPARAGTTSAEGGCSGRTPRRSRTAGAPIGDAGVSRAIGQAGEHLVAAEAEVLSAGLVNWPAALSLLELEQRAAAPVVNRYLLGLHLRKGLAQHPALRDNEPSPGVPFRTRELGRAPHLRRKQIARARQPHPVHLADHGIASDPNLARDLATGEPGVEAAFELLDALRAPGQGGGRHSWPHCLT